MNATLPSWVRARKHSWLLLLLLPVLPVLSQLMPGSPGAVQHAELSASQSFFSLMIGGNGSMSLLVPWALVLMGGVLAVASSAWIRRIDPALLKEVDLLRPAWLTCVFGTQFSLLFGNAGFGFCIFFFVASCALLSALPVGAEFQQKTMAGLLSQPVERSETWRRKMGVLGLALLLHWAVASLSLLSTREKIDEWIIPALLGAAILAWATTPWWTLVTRGLLPGLVFSLTVPPLVLVVIALVFDGGIPAEALEDGMLYGLGTGYAVLAMIWSKRRWRTLEVRELSSRETSGIFLPFWSVRSASGSPARESFRRLLVKELRLQSLTWLSLGVAVILGLTVARENQATITRDLWMSLTILMCGMTIILAGATPFAEERRLGTLSSYWTVPLTRTFQWWVKVLVAGMFCLAACVILSLTFSRLAMSDLSLSELFLPLNAFVFLAAALFVSSVSANALRAMLFTILFTGLTLATVSVVIVQTLSWHHREQTRLEQWIPSVDEAGQASPEQVSEWTRQSQAAMHGTLERILEIAGIVGFGGLALFFARRNHFQAFTPPRRAITQASLCLLVGLVFLIPALLISRLKVLDRFRAVRMLEAVNFAAQLRELPPGDRRLLDTYRAAELSLLVIVPLTGSRADETIPLPVHLPLTPEVRKIAIRHGALSQDLRVLLHEDAVRLDDPNAELLPEPEPYAVSAPEEAAPTPQFQMSPELMRRYGLLHEPGSTNRVEE